MSYRLGIRVESVICWEGLIPSTALVASGSGPFTDGWNKDFIAGLYIVFVLGKESFEYFQQYIPRFIRDTGQPL